MILTINELTPAQFLRDYWQKKPLVIRQGFNNFQDFLSPDEMAGLASEAMVESRRVYKEHGQWQAEFGPFDSYEHLGEKNWTFIVQALNNWLPQVEELITCFDFIPRWRLDDVMASYATPGGSVGPHIDLYDVFICQGSGSRRWRVGDIGEHHEFAAHPALLHVEEFDAMIDVELRTGDILYLPPGFPHEGVSVSESMSFSVGYRTASARDTHSALADYLIDNNLAKQQISDPGRPLSTTPGQIDAQDFARIKQQLLATFDDEMLADFAGRYLTQSKCELDLPQESLDFQVSDVSEMIKQQPLIRLGGLRCLYLELTYTEGVFYINGEQQHLPLAMSDAIPLLCDSPSLEAVELAPWLSQPLFIEQLTAWINLGYWYFEE